MASMLALSLFLSMSAPCDYTGRVQFVERRVDADISVLWVDLMPDLRVRFGPGKGCGRWSRVASNPDFRVYSAGDGERYDFRAQVVESFPG